MSIRPLSTALAEKARVELNEDPKTFKEDLQHLKDWIAKQAHLRARTDDQWLIAFLRGCKYSLERTKEKLDLYYSLRSTAPEFYRIKYSDPIFKELLELGSFLILPKTAEADSTRVVLIRPGAYNPEKYHITQILSLSGVLQKILMFEDDNIIVSGVRSVMDLEGVTMAHFLQMSPILMKKMAVISQDAVPVRMKSAHYLNTPPGFETVFNTMKGFLNEKNRNRLYVHNKKIEDMYSYIPKKILPAEYGGEAGTIKEIVEYWKNKVDEYGPWLEEDLQFGTDESKRPGKPKTAESMFGLEGSFRQLQVD